MKCFYGEVHAHTDESDGRGTPAEAYEYARNVGHVDYFSVTDHNFGKFRAERFFDLMPGLAEEKNEDGKFAALYGYEMTYGAPTGFYGHANIIPPKEIFWTKLSLDEWYDEMARVGEDGVGQFNHPGDKWGNFNDFKYDERMDKIFSIMELRITEYGISCIEEEYDRALRMGWHISPVSNEDTHGANWTTSREETGAVVAESLTRENVLDAMRKNRTYATTDRTLQIYYKANGEWMGARLKKTGSLNVELEVSTEKECGIGVLQLVGEHNVVLAQIDAGTQKSYRWEITLPDDQRYVYVKRIAGMHYAITGAIFVEQDAPVDVKITTNYQGGRLVATADVQNLGDEEISDLSVTWIPACVSVEKKAPRFKSLLKDAEAGKTVTAGYTSPILPEHTRLIVQVRGIYKNQPIAINRIVYLSALSITQFFTNTKTYLAQGYTKQPFCCFDIFNNTDAKIDISKYQFRIYNCGLHQEFRIPRKIEPHGTLTVWLRGPGGSNTIEDFNAYFGTSLTEKDVYFCSEKFGAEDGTRKLAICYGDEVICRAYVRGDGYHKVDVPATGCFRYRPTQECATMEVLELREKAMPREHFIYELETLALPAGPALAVYEPKELKEINRLAVLCDGTADLAAFEDKVRSLMPNVKEIKFFVGENDGEKGLHSYFFFQAHDMVCEAIAYKPDALLVAIGGNDLGKKRADWFQRNFVSFSTVAVNLTRQFYVQNVPLYFTTPILTEEQKPEENMLVHSIKTVANTLGATLVGMPEEIIPVSEIEPCVRIAPKADAIRVAVVGDQYCEGSSVAPAYAALLQGVLGENYDVRIFSKNRARIAAHTDTPYFEFAEREAKAMEKFAPQIILSWFGVADLKRELAVKWEVFKPDFIEGYDAFLKKILASGAKVIMISPFHRRMEDIRKTVVCQDGGMKDTVAQIAEQNNLPLVDFFTPTQENEDLVGVRKKVDYLTRKGTETLVELVVKAIEELD